MLTVVNRTKIIMDKLVELGCSNIETLYYQL